MSTATGPSALVALDELVALLTPAGWPVLSAPSSRIATTPAVLVEPADPFAEASTIAGFWTCRYRVHVLAARLDNDATMRTAIDALSQLAPRVQRAPAWSVEPIGPMGMITIAGQDAPYYGGAFVASTLTRWEVRPDA